MTKPRHKPPKRKSVKPSEKKGNSQKTERRKAGNSVDDNPLFGPVRLLDLARLAWERADWPALAAIAERPLELEADRARLALLVAAGLAQQGSLEGSRRHANLALRWGCPPHLLARVLASGAYNSLGRAAVLIEDEANAIRYFEAAIAATGPIGELQQTARARWKQERTNLNTAPAPTAAPAKASDALDRFRKLLPNWNAEQDLPRLIETKSLPRSGLHLLKSHFETTLAKRFSFCEWYQEPGCCRQQPCAVAQLALEQPQNTLPPLRMVKSHDFDLADSTYAPPPGILRLVLVRDPLMILTSWWALEELERHRTMLANHGIRMEKIYFSHEKPILETAYALLEKHFRPVPHGIVERWLQQKSAYIAGFLNKWCVNPTSQVLVLPYEGIPDFLPNFLAQRLGGLSEPEQQRVERLRSDPLMAFHPRTDPFQARAFQITETLLGHKTAFLAASEHIREVDKSGVSGLMR